MRIFITNNAPSIQCDDNDSEWCRQPPAESHCLTHDDRIRAIAENGKRIYYSFAIKCHPTYRSLLCVMVPLMRTIEPCCMPPGICARCGTLYGGTEDKNTQKHTRERTHIGGAWDCVDARRRRKLLRNMHRPTDYGDSYHIVDGQR